MIWAILAAIGVPLWLYAVGIGAVVFRNRKMRNRPGNIPGKLHGLGKESIVATLTLGSGHAA